MKMRNKILKWNAALQDWMCTDPLPGILVPIYLIYFIAIMMLTNGKLWIFIVHTIPAVMHLASSFLYFATKDKLDEEEAAKGSHKIKELEPVKEKYNVMKRLIELNSKFWVWLENSPPPLNTLPYVVIMMLGALIVACKNDLVLTIGVIALCCVVTSLGISMSTDYYEYDCRDTAKETVNESHEVKELEPVKEKYNVMKRLVELNNKFWVWFENSPTPLNILPYAIIMALCALIALCKNDTMFNLGIIAIGCVGSSMGIHAFTYPTETPEEPMDKEETTPNNKVSNSRIKVKVSATPKETMAYSKKECLGLLEGIYKMVSSIPSSTGLEDLKVRIVKIKDKISKVGDTVFDSVLMDSVKSLADAVNNISKRATYMNNQQIDKTISVITDMVDHISSYIDSEMTKDVNNSLANLEDLRDVFAERFAEMNEQDTVEDIDDLESDEVQVVNLE